MLRILSAGYSMPYTWMSDPSAEFQPGQIAQLVSIGNQIVATVSDGTNPLGIIDDMRTRAFTKPQWEEIVQVSVSNTTLNGNGNKVTAEDIKLELENPNVLPSSFVSSAIPVQLIPRNGVIIIPSGTELNIDLDGDGIPDGVRTLVNYLYYIPGIPGEDSTAGNGGRIAIWYDRIIFETDVYDTTSDYAINGLLFVNEAGMLTAKQPSKNIPAVAICLAPPSIVTGYLQALWL